MNETLRKWFVFHFIIDYIFAIPLMFFPVWSMELLGLNGEVVTVRLVAAALFGIGGISLVVRNETKEVFKSMLIMKSIWSFSAMLALLLSIFEGGSRFLRIMFWIFYIT